MAAASRIELAEWRVTFTMAAGEWRRTFSFDIPAASEEQALDGARGLAYAINDASAHVWKVTDAITATAVTA
jgi:hypothetical protein